MKFGIDVSSYDHRYNGIDWSLASKKVDFAFIKCFEYFEDPYFKIQFDNSRGYLPRAPYYFWRQSTTKTETNKKTDMFLKVIDGIDNELPVVLDIEDRKASLGSALGDIDILSEIIKRETGRYPIIYVGLSYWSEIGGTKLSTAWGKVHPLWLSLPNVDSSKTFETQYTNIMSGNGLPFIPAVPKPFSRIDFFQWTYRGKPTDIPGYPTGILAKKAIDFNFYFGTDAEFNTLCGKSDDEVETPIPVEYTLEEKVNILWGEYLSKKG
jgi:GH25 family lysozyme M1 (1,4-beta-N-acetylmuramidase)